MDISILQPLSWGAAAIGVCVAAFYYVMTLRITQRNLKTTIDTRQIQVLMQISEISRSPEGMKRYTEWMNMEWKDYDDFERRFGSDNNRDNYALRESMNGYFNALGLLLRYKIVDPLVMWDFNGPQVIWCWQKWREIFITQRVIYNMPRQNERWEYLYDEMVKIAEEIGHPVEYSKTPFKYTDDMKVKVGSGSQ